MKREIDLSPYIQSIMDTAEKFSERDYLMLALIGEGAGFRRGEVTGNRDRREVWNITNLDEDGKSQFERSKKKSDMGVRKRILDYLKTHPDSIIEAEDGEYSLIRNGSCVLKMRKANPLPGLQVEDLHDGAIWVKGKGGTEFQQPLPDWLYKRLKAFIGDRTTGPIFDFSADGLYKKTRYYSKLAGVPDWKLVHPHRFRHAYIKSTYKKLKDPVMTQALARHKDFNMTRHYIGEVDIEEKRAAVQSIWK